MPGCKRLVKHSEKLHMHRHEKVEDLREATGTCRQLQRCMPVTLKCTNEELLIDRFGRSQLVQTQGHNAV